MISNISYYKNLKSKSDFNGKLKHNVDLSKFTWLQTGGKAKLFLYQKN